MINNEAEFIYSYHLLKKRCLEYKLFLNIGLLSDTIGAKFFLSTTEDFNNGTIYESKKLQDIGSFLDGLKYAIEEGL